MGLLKSHDGSEIRPSSSCQPSSSCDQDPLHLDAVPECSWPMPRPTSVPSNRCSKPKAPEGCRFARSARLDWQAVRGACQDASRKVSPLFPSASRLRLVPLAATAAVTPAGRASTSVGKTSLQPRHRSINLRRASSPVTNPAPPDKFASGGVVSLHKQPTERVQSPVDL